MKIRNIETYGVIINRAKKTSKAFNISKLKHKNNYLVIELERCRIKLNSKKRNLIKKLIIRNFREALYNFIILSSENYDNYYFERVNKVNNEHIIIYHSNEPIARVSFSIKIKYSIKERKYYVDEIKVNMIINNKVKKKKVLDTALSVLLALSIIFKKNYEIVENSENLEKHLEKYGEYIDKIISKHTYEVY